MYHYIIAYSLISTIPVLIGDKIYSESSQADFQANLKQSLSALNVDSEIMKQLFTSGSINEQGDDAALRPRYVNAQAAFEQTLAQELNLGRLKQVIAVIHTPLPATPFCTNGEVTADLVDPAILKDEKRLQTVRERPAILRAFLQSGATLMSAYPAVARTKRTPEQLAVFESLLSKYPNHLFDVPLGCLEVAPEMVGATYIFETAQGEWLTYSVRFTQAISPQNPTFAGMWFGSVDKGPAAERLAQVATYLRACQGPDLTNYIQR